MDKKVRIGVCSTIIGEKGTTTQVPAPRERLTEISGVEWATYDCPQGTIAPEQVEGFDIVIAGSPSWTRQSVEGNRQLVSIIKASAGYDKLDVSALTGAGVMLLNIPEATQRPVAVAIMTLILALNTRLMLKNRLVRENRWKERFNYLGYGLQGKTLGSIGIGHIGRELFGLARPFDMNHIAYDPYVSQEAVADIGVRLVDFDTVLAESDFLNISCPLTEKTRHLVGEKELKKMKQSAFLINTSRGGVVDEAALIKALAGDWIRGAGLDVLEKEPPLLDNPLLKMDSDKVIVTPHALAGTDEKSANYAVHIIKKVKQLIAGEVPDGLVNREVLDKPELKAKFNCLHDKSPAPRQHRVPP